MNTTLTSFAAQVHDILQHSNTPATREQVAALLRGALQDRAFVDSLFDDASPERKVVYQDPDLGFCILAHRYTGAKASPPHDHGPSWAIYGQAEGETVMSEWEVVGAAPPGQPAKVRKVREYALKPGEAHLYNEGDVHAPTRYGATRLIRIEGVNMESVRRGSYRE
jgi:predicted metal-dependent enzyme (double-stranded beta helix superfamily)